MDHVRLTSFGPGQAAELLALYRAQWWSRGRTAQDVQVVLAESDVLVGLARAGSERLVAFARVLTDRRFKALIFDVIVAPAERGAGLGRRLVQEILDDPTLSGVRDFELYCLPELEPFYARLGFGPEVGGVRLLRRTATGR